MVSPRNYWLALVSLPLMVVGALSPWAQERGTTVDGTQDELVLGLAIAAAVLIVVLAASHRRWLAALPLLLGLTAAAVTGNDIHDIGDFAPGVGGGLVAVDWGIYLALIGSVGLVLGTALLLAEATALRRPSMEVAASASVTGATLRRSVTAETDPPVEIIPIEYERHNLRIRAESKYERSWRARAGRREPWTVAWLETETRRGDVLYDIGANVGVFSLIGAAALRGEGLVVAFEPGFASYARLCENIALNELSSMVVPLPLALSRTSGLQAFTYRTQHAGQSRHGFSADAWSAELSASRKRHTQPIAAVTLDEVVPLLELPRPNLVKLDVDGAEMHVLRGGRQTLCAPECRSLFIEIDSAHSEEVVSLLESYGFYLEARHRRKESSKVWYGTFRRFT